MKELSIEEKAKRYDEVIERVRKELQACGSVDCDAAKQIFRFFPELKESEDEGMVKFIKNQLFNIKKTITENYELDAKLTKAINWLEKQGEQNLDTDFSNLRTWKYIVDAVWTEKEGIGQYLDSPFTEEVAKKLQKRFGNAPKEVTYTYEVETGNGNIKSLVTEKLQLPKFKVGDWVVHKCGEETATLQITRIVGKTYVFSDDSTLSVADEDTLRLWDITKDAKDGDVLATSAGAFIYNSNNGGGSCPGCYCGINTLGNFKVGVEHHWTGKPVFPATKKQCDTLMKAMTDAGYTFDFEKKELKKIEQKPAEWHREDEQNLNACLGYIPDEFLRRWLTDIIHVKYDKSVELPKGEDYGIDGLYAAVDILKKTLGKVDGYQSDDGILEHKCAITAVKKLYRQEPAWSEEDGKMIRFIGNAITAEDAALYLTSKGIKIIDAHVWLNGLKDRVQPQSIWKPSEEMLEALYKAIPENVMAMSEDKVLLDKLYQGLKYGRVLGKN